MASATSAVVTPSDYSTPLASLDPDNRSGWIIITVAFLIVVLTSCLAIRVFVRLKTTSTLGSDDACFAGAFLFAIVESGLLLAAVRSGIGNTIDNIDESQLEPAQRYAYAAVLCFIFAIYLAKASVLVFFQRLSPQLFSRLIWIALNVALISCAVASTFLVALTCELSQPWLQYNRDCSGLEAQWQSVTALNIATEVVLVSVAVYLVWGLQMPFVRKIKVVCAFAARVPLIAVASVHLHFVTEQIASPDSTFAGAIPSVIRQVEIGFSLLSALIPCLRPFLTEFYTDFMAMGGNTIIAGTAVGTASGSRTRTTTSRLKDDYYLKNLDTQSKSGTRNHRMSGMNSTIVDSSKGPNVHAGPDSDSITSHSSQQQIIRKTTEWKVESGSSRSM